MNLLKKIWLRRLFLLNVIYNWIVYLINERPFFNKNPASNNNVVIFVRTISDIRIFKQAYGLKKYENIKTIFFTNILDYFLMESAFNLMFPIISNGYLLKRIKKIGLKNNIICIHVSSPLASVCQYVIKQKLPWPIIFDQYDSHLVTYGADMNFMPQGGIYDPNEQIKNEKYCYEHADKIISRTSEIEYVKTVISVLSPTLIYADYANHDWFQHPKPLMASKDNDIHLVYIGGISEHTSEENLLSNFFYFCT